MKNNYYFRTKNRFLFLIPAFLIALMVRGQATQTVTFNYTGAAQNFTVPICVSTISIEVMGAQGGDSEDACGPGPWDIDGGLGGSATGVLNVTAGQVLSIYVGQKPVNNQG